AGAGIDVPFAPPSFQALARAIETVRSDAGHLFAAIQRENPYAEEARGRLVEALASIDRALKTPAEERDTEDSTRFVIPELDAGSPPSSNAGERIDDVDREIVRLLARRSELTRHAGPARDSDPIADPARLEARREWARKEGLDAGAVEAVLRVI